MTNKDQELTKKDLIALCRNQEQYIKELEEKLRTLSDTEKIQVAEPDYDELWRMNQVLHNRIFQLEKEIEALRFSLTETHRELKRTQSREEIWEEDYYKEHKRAEKLFEDLNELKR
jgi:transcriptional regulator with XRE-family HTH domain